MVIKKIKTGEKERSGLWKKKKKVYLLHSKERRKKFKSLHNSLRKLQ